MCFLNENGFVPFLLCVRNRFGIIQVPSIIASITGVDLIGGACATDRVGIYIYSFVSTFLLFQNTCNSYSANLQNYNEKLYILAKDILK